MSTEHINAVHMESFLTIAEFGTVTAAAQHLRLAQPAVSRHVQRLERDLGVTLFDRSGRRLTLTAAGRDFAVLARQMRGATRQFHRASNELAAGRIDQLVLAAPETSIVEIVAPFLVTLRPEDPWIRVQREPPRQLHAALGNGADIVISSEPLLSSLANRPLVSVPLRAFVPAGHGWSRANYPSVPLVELVQERLLLLPPDYITRGILDRAVIRAGLEYSDVEECSISRVIQAHAAAGFGVGVLTEGPHFGLHAPLVTADGDEPLLLHLHASWSPDHYAANLIADLVDRMVLHARNSPLAYA